MAISLQDAQANYYGGGAQAQLGSDFNALSPYVSTVSSAPTAQQQVIKQTSGTGGNLAQFEHFVGGLFQQTGNIAEGAAKWLGSNIANMVTGAPRLGAGIGNAYLDNSAIDAINKQGQQLSQRLQTLHADFKSNRINSVQYKAGLKDLTLESGNLDKQNMQLNSKINLDKTATTKALIDTASTVMIVATTGFGAAGDAALKASEEGLSIAPIATQKASQWLMSKATSQIFDPVASVIQRIAPDSGVFRTLDTASKQAIQTATAEVVANAGTTMTAGQIARATAVNIALKYPIFFNYASSTASQVYGELDQAKYGDAIRTLAFNAALLLSGGPIAQAIKYGGKAAEGVTARTFGHTQFWDELGKLHGDPAVYINTIRSEALKITDVAARNQYIKDLATAEAINVGAMNGDAAAAAMRVVKGMNTAYGIDLTSGEPLDHIHQMVTLAQDMRLAQQTADKLGLGNVAVGIWDTRAKSAIADAVTQGATSEERLQAWEAFKQANATESYANSPTVDAIVTNAIKHSDDPAAIRQEITSVKARQGLDGIPKNVSDQLAKNGHIIIRPSRLEAPFKEGADKITTAFNGSEDFFTKAVQPLPVLQTVGAIFTRMGLSPISSSQKSYEYFNDYLTKNLEDTKAARSITQKIEAKAAEQAAKAAAKVAPTAEVTGLGLSKDELALLKKQGITPETNPDIFKKAEVHGEAQAGAGTAAGPVEQTVAKATTKKQLSATDTMLKKLSSYAHGLRVSTQDLRMLTNKQIQEALKVSRSEAQEVMDAITKAHMQVPLAVRGLGDRAVDWSYNLPGSAPIARRYLKVQGALRFSFNPFFQYLRLIPKTEILTEAEGGGFLRSVFNGRFDEIGAIRKGLRDSGMFDEVGHFGDIMSGEAVDATGTVGKNLVKHLLPAQEVSIAGLIDSQAQRMGVGWQDYITKYPQNARDTIQMIAEYDKRSNFLNSPLARTLNVAIFPFRFETKVAMIMARNLAKTSLMTQVSFVNGLMKAHDFLSSDEGKAWYAQNADAIGLFKYITPFLSMEEAMTSLLPGHDHSLGNFGELGGLPFGWLPQILDSEGLTQFNQPSVDAKTGQVIPKYIPITAKGQAAAAIQDFISMLFSYPGKQVGLPSKTSITRSFAIGITGANKSTDFKQVTPDISAQQQDYSNSIQGLNNRGTNGVQILPTPQPINSNIPTTGTNIAPPRPKNSSSPGPKKKKSQYTPALLPGQSTLGQL